VAVGRGDFGVWRGERSNWAGGVAAAGGQMILVMGGYTIFRVFEKKLYLIISHLSAVAKKLKKSVKKMM
jgi:hypothetical protein